MLYYILLITELICSINHNINLFKKETCVSNNIITGSIFEEVKAVLHWISTYQYLCLYMKQ